MMHKPKPKRKSLSKWAVISRRSSHETPNTKIDPRKSQLQAKFFIYGDRQELNGRMATTLTSYTHRSSCDVELRKCFLIQCHNSPRLGATDEMLRLPTLLVVPYQTRMRPMGTSRFLALDFTADPFQGFVIFFPS